MSHPARDAWIEIEEAARSYGEVERSHPARDAWIEMSLGSFKHALPAVASRKGCVD